MGLTLRTSTESKIVWGSVTENVFRPHEYRKYFSLVVNGWLLIPLQKANTFAVSHEITMQAKYISGIRSVLAATEVQERFCGT